MLPPTHQENDKKIKQKKKSQANRREEISPARYAPEGSRKLSLQQEEPPLMDLHRLSIALCTADPDNNLKIKQTKQLHFRDTTKKEEKRCKL